MNFKRMIWIIGSLGFFSINAFGQTVTYLDDDFKPTSSSSYTYREVATYRAPVIAPNAGVSVRGNITVNPMPTGFVTCSVIAYYRTGEPARVTNGVSSLVDCSAWFPDGQQIFYYKNGNIRGKVNWSAGKLQGTLIGYDEAGREILREEYENGKLIEPGKFRPPANSPLIGTWKYLEYTKSTFGILEPRVTKAITAVFSADGILDITVAGFSTSREKTNWKYTARDDSSGVLEQYQGDDLAYRGDVRWINRNQFEYTNSFNQNPAAVGTKILYTRE